MPETPLGLPYPRLTDSANVPRDLKALADASDAAIVNTVAVEAAARAAADLVIAATTQTADYTLVIGDAGRCVEMDNPSARTITIPPNASVAFPIGTVIELYRKGAGSVTLIQGASVTLPNKVQAAGTTNRTLTSQCSVASIRKRATNEWALSGDIA